MDVTVGPEPPHQASKKISSRECHKTLKRARDDVYCFQPIWQLYDYERDGFLDECRDRAYAVTRRTYSQSI